MNQCCGTCNHYDPERNPDTNKICPTKGGKCICPMPEYSAIVWPVAYYQESWSSRPEIPKLPHQKTMYRCGGRDCKRYEPIKKLKQKQSSNPQLIFEVEKKS